MGLQDSTRTGWTGVTVEHGTYPVTDIAGFFAGTWQIERAIVDADGHALGSFTGSAEFQLDGAVLHYHEHGVLDLGSYQGPAQRALRYWIDGPGQAQVYFDYGEFFHDLDLRHGSWHTRHPCRDDLYCGEYHVLGPHRWWQRWQVSGPTKNHTLTTTFHRQ